MQEHHSETENESGMRKVRLREALLRLRSGLPPAQREAAAAAIGGGVIRWWEVNRPATIGVYWPIRSEPDLRDAYRTLAERGVRLALPVVRDECQPLHFLAWTPGDAIREDRFGVAIPAAEQSVAPDALLIPCVGFNPMCMRLGYGGGFYDRTLALSPRPLTLGIAYDCGAAEFDGQPHDIALDMVLTESRLLTNRPGVSR
ncbi:MAG: 5-formyltetrahydrofolate cyclo-ligase [Herbaspirillum sp.]|jgi:5-formyltetrahydrofolate cyclo-ligase|nr:5-formyltetrahydrofolate cyclo-ligase [Herbaspirillum sp.]